MPPGPVTAENMSHPHPDRGTGRLAKDGAESSRDEITGMVRQGGFVTGVLVTPDFVAAGTRTVILIAEGSQTPDDLPVFEARQAAH